MQARHPLGHPIRTGEPNGNARQRRKARRTQVTIVTHVDHEAKTVTVTSVPRPKWKAAA